MERTVEVWSGGRLQRRRDADMAALCREVERVVRTHESGRCVRTVVLVFDEPPPGGPAVTVDVYDSGYDAER